MGKIIKIILILVLLAIAVLAGIIFTTDINQYKEKIIQVVKDNTGRDFEISGDLKLIPSLIPTIGVEGVTLGNANWSNEQDMLSVNKFEVQVSLIPLLKKNVQIKRLVLIEPNIYLETNTEGVGNWVLADSKPNQTKQPKDGAAAPVALAINKVQIKDATVSYKDGKTGKLTKLFIDEVTLDSFGLTDSLDLTVKATVNNEPLTIKATLGSINSFLGNKDYPIELDANLAGAMVMINGQLDQPRKAKGLKLKLALTIKNLRDLNEVTNSELPDVGPIIVNGQLADTKSGYALKEMTAQLLEYNIAGNVQVDLKGARPKITAHLSSNELDVSPFQKEAKKDVKKEKLFPKTPLPLDGLKIVDVDMTFKTKKLITKSLAINDVKLRLNLSNGKLKLSQQGGVAGGSISSKIDLDASNGKIAELHNDIVINQLELGLLPAIKEKGMIDGGKTDITIKTRGSGSSVAAIMASLNGTLLMKTGAGKISSTILDKISVDALMSILSMLVPDAEKIDGSLLECAVVNFDIKDGIATTDKGIAIMTNQMNIIGSGTINLKTEELDLGIKPKVNKGVGLNLGQLAGLIRIGGTLANPAPKADVETALTTWISAGATATTGGLSLLAEGLLKGADSDENPCNTALGIVSEKNKATTAEKNTLKDNPVDAIKNAAGAIGDKLKKKLF